jgi:hypothetical protein
MDLEATREFTASGLKHSEEKKKHGVIALHGWLKNAVGEVPFDAARAKN